MDDVARAYVRIVDRFCSGAPPSVAQATAAYSQIHDAEHVLRTAHLPHVHAYVIDVGSAEIDIKHGGAGGVRIRNVKGGKQHNSPTRTQARARAKTQAIATSDDESENASPRFECAFVTMYNAFRGNAHSNVLVRVGDAPVERFEPHGASQAHVLQRFCDFRGYYDAPSMDAALQRVSARLFPGVPFINMDARIPIGPQSTSPKAVKKAGELGDSFCWAWARMYAALRAECARVRAPVRALDVMYFMRGGVAPTTEANLEARGRWAKQLVCRFILADAHALGCASPSARQVERIGRNLALRTRSHENENENENAERETNELMHVQCFSKSNKL